MAEIAATQVIQDFAIIIVIASAAALFHTGWSSY
jgi:hypothetical protein